MWGAPRGGWRATARTCRCRLQARSIAKLADEPFSWVLPGHGRRHHFATAGERAAAIRTAAEEFAADPMGKTAPGFVYVTPAGPNGSGGQ